MLRIQVYAARAAELLPDRAMQKDMEAVFERYAPPGGAEQPQLTNEQVDAMLAGVKAHVEAFCSGFPMPFGEEGEEEEGGAAPRPASRTGGRKAAGLAAESSSEDDSEGDAGESEPAVARRMPARSTRVAKTLAESDDSDDDEVKPAERAAPNTGADSDSSDDEEDEEDSESEEDVEEENAQRLSSARKARRASTESVAALRDALRENARIQ